MNPITKAKNQYFTVTVLGSIIILTLGFAGGFIAYEYFAMELTHAMVAGLAVSILAALAVGEWLSELAVAPLKMIDKAASMIAHNSQEALPTPEKLSIARDTTNQTLKDIYDITTNQHQALLEKSKSVDNAMAAINNINAPIFSLDRNLQINFYNAAAEQLANPTLTSLKGSLLSDAFDLKFNEDRNFESWLSQAEQNKIHDCAAWQRVKLETNNEVKFFDLFACYSKNDSEGHEVVISMLDFSDRYASDEREISFVSLAVHELRSPLTVLRGYIEVFQDEVGPNLSEEYKHFMSKMSVAAGQLSTFVNNILNVSRIENEQMNVSPKETNWKEYLENAANDFRIRAEVRGRQLNLSVPENLDSVAADPVSVYEVLSNMVDNAIKYTGKDGVITISAKQLDNGYVETTVNDNGIGIPSSVIEHLFDKFYRSHRSRENIGGTGLGLFLSKQIIEAHNGEVWVKSKEGEGSTFGFNLPSYETAKHDLANPDKMTMKRSTHGWIKNHGKVRK